jgi:SAM-dependent methyltransferase
VNKHAADDPIVANRLFWENEVKRGCGLTIPWLDLEVENLNRCISGEYSPRIPDKLSAIFPWDILSNVYGKDVLCLASGGGQQSAVFGLLGASVTVVDIANGQLEGDHAAAKHFGYPVRTVRADAQDMSLLDSDSFDIVWQGSSMAYIPEIRSVYSEVARVLRSEGVYRSDANDAGTAFADEHWDNGYRINRPFSDRVLHREDGAVEYRHYLSDVINGLAESGFMIQRAVEDPNHLEVFPDAVPGNWQHITMHLPQVITIIATKI